MSTLSLDKQQKLSWNLGLCVTGMNVGWSHKFGKDPMEGAKVPVSLATLKKGEKTGMYVNHQQVLPW